MQPTKAYKKMVSCLLKVRINILREKLHYGHSRKVKQFSRVFYEVIKSIIESCLVKTERKSFNFRCGYISLFHDKTKTTNKTMKLLSIPGIADQKSIDHLYTQNPVH